MPKTLRYNNTIPGNIYYNNTKAKKVFYNNILVWSSNVIEGNLAVGNVILFDDKYWRVIHNPSDNYWILALEYWEEDTIYDNDLSKKYMTDPYNALRQKCNTFYNNMSVEAKNYIQPSNRDISIKPGSYYVWIPESKYIEYNIFTYFSDKSKCIFRDRNGGAHNWLTATAYREHESGLDLYIVDHVTTSGIVNGSSNNTAGFRPHMLIKV